MDIIFYNNIFYFLVYSFLGWCIEVTYATIKTKKFVNRGFLNGPLCPIYGFGAIFVNLTLSPLKEKSVILLFLGAVFLTSFLEFVTGFVLERFFKKKWWDYSEENFNIFGYVCLRFSILWGVACLFVVNDIQPVLEKFVSFVPLLIGKISVGVVTAIFIADFIATVVNLLQIKYYLKVMDKIAVDLKEFSNDIGEKLFEKVTTFIDTIERKEQVLKVEKYKFLTTRYESLKNKKLWTKKRVLSAFPGLNKDKKIF